MKTITYFNAMRKTRDDMESYALRRRRGKQGIRVDSDWFADLWRKRSRQYDKFLEKMYQRLFVID